MFPPTPKTPVLLERREYFHWPFAVFAKRSICCCSVQVLTQDFSFLISDPIRQKLAPFPDEERGYGEPDYPAQHTETIWRVVLDLISLCIRKFAAFHRKRESTFLLFSARRSHCIALHCHTILARLLLFGYNHQIPVQK